MKRKLGLILSVSLASMLLASCVSSVTPPTKDKKVKDYIISVQANGNQKTLEINPVGNAKCKNSNGQDNGKFGCVDVGIDQQAQSTFKLTPASWQIEEIKICDGGTKDLQNCSLSVEAQKEFAIMLEDNLNRYFPNAKGVIDIGNISGGISTFQLVDFNNIKDPKEYFYTLKACKESNPGFCVTTDPLIKNGGRQ